MLYNCIKKNDMDTVSSVTVERILSINIVKDEKNCLLIEIKSLLMVINL